MRCVSKYTPSWHAARVQCHYCGRCSASHRPCEESLHPVRRRLLCNPNFTHVQRSASLFSRLLCHDSCTMRVHGSSLMPRTTMPSARDTLASSRLCPTHLQCACRRLDDMQVCALLGAMLPDEALACARIRTLAAASAKGHDFLKTMLLREQAWLGAALQAVRTVATQLKSATLVDWVNQVSVDDSFPQWPLSAGATHSLLRRFRHQVVTARHDLVGPAEAKARLHDRAAAAGVHYMNLPTMRATAALTYALYVRFPSALRQPEQRTWLSATRIPAGSSFATGSALPNMYEAIWTTKRLKQHLRSSPRCAAVYGRGGFGL